MTIDMTKIANVVLYMLQKDVKHLNDRKLSILLFLIDFQHQKATGNKIFNDTYIKSSRNPEPEILSDLFDMIANEEEYFEEDERVYLLEELFNFLDIEIIPKDTYVELQFVKIEEDFDESIFVKEEMKTIRKVVNQYIETTVRNLANDTFKIEEVRSKQNGEVII